KKQQELVSRLSILIDQTMVSASEEMVSSAKLNEYGAEAIELMGSIMGTKDDLSSFLEVIPVRNAIFAGAFSLEENIDIAKKYPVSWLMIVSDVNLGLGAAGLITANSIFYTAGRASLIADMGAGIPIGIVHAIREGRLLANVAVGAEVGNVARFARLARVGKLISRASAVLLAISAGFLIVGWIDKAVKKSKYKKELEQSIREL
ncbi:hypothetical protein D6089_23785, partial [Vibrio vulnificus]|nr:hypothetical protein [Vibrio vulnificus]